MSRYAMSLIATSRNRRHPQARPQARGFTLIEALVTLMLVSVGLLGLAQLQVRALTASANSKAQTTAVGLAQQKIEELRGIRYDLLASSADQPAAQPGDNAAYSRRWSVTPAATSALAYKAVSITTSWQSAEGETRSLTLGTVIAQTTPAQLIPIGLVDPTQSGGTSVGTGGGTGDAKNRGQSKK